MPSQKQRFSDTTPAPPPGSVNVIWQADPPDAVGTIRNISAYVDTANIAVPSSDYTNMFLLMGG